MTHVTHASLIGRFMYTMISTRPDILHTVSMISSYTHDPRKDHWQFAKWILRYILGINELGLRLEKRLKIQLVNYVDSDYVSDQDKCHYVMGYLFTCAKALVSWSLGGQFYSPL